MTKLYVLYDEECGVCRRCRSWLETQPAFVPLVFLALQSPETVARFPGIGAFHPEKEIVVISDAGEVWQGAAAWVTCLWALRETREWSLRLADPTLLPLARRVCALVSEHRGWVSAWLGQPAEEEVGSGELLRRLEAMPEPGCGDDGCGVERERKGG